MTNVGLESDLDFEPVPLYWQRLSPQVYRSPSVVTAAVYVIPQSICFMVSLKHLTRVGTCVFSFCKLWLALPNE